MSPLEPLKELVRPYYLRWIYFPLFPDRRPTHFSTCWNAPAVSSLPHGAVAPGVIFYPMNDWHGRQQRSHHLARSFARQGRSVLYLNPHFGRQFESIPLGAPPVKLCRLEENLFELHPRLEREPVFHHRLLNRAESVRVADAVESVGGGREWIQIVSYPTWFDAAVELRRRHGWPIVYDCHDLLRGLTNVAPEIVQREPGALAESDRVLFSSANLQREFAADSSLAAKTRIVRNAVDAGLFSGFVPCEDGAAVYAGALERWFDVEAVAEAARCNPGRRFVLAGRVDAGPVRELATLPNVELVGEVAFSDVPRTLARGRIGLIPFRVDELTLATNPVKLYEYFSLGMPVAATPLPEVEAFADLVYIGGTPAAFAEAVRLALAEDDPGKRDRRRRIAAAESWTSRAEALASEFGALGRVPGVRS